MDLGLICPHLKILIGITPAETISQVRWQVPEIIRTQAQLLGATNQPHTPMLITWEIIPFHLFFFFFFFACSYGDYPFYALPHMK